MKVYGEALNELAMQAVLLVERLLITLIARPPPPDQHGIAFVSYDQ